MNFIYRYLKKKHPFEFSEISEQLFVAAWPTGENYETINALGVRLVINMDWVPADKMLGRPPLRVLSLTEIDSPFTPMKMANLWKGVEIAQETIKSGEGVMVYCKGGVHRSVVMACCILISQGYGAEDAMAQVKESRPIADPYKEQFKSRILAFEGEWKTRDGS